jgi:dihydrofolate reductase|tara:strand:+ start:117 stop:605 length:489 start_codon:yes stop_codon:yes gene_type:complete
MIRAIMAADDKGGISKNGSMPWPKNSSDLKWFKKNTLNSVVVMGRLTWEDPFMPTPLKNRVNVLITKKNKEHYPNANEYISTEIKLNVSNLLQKYKDKNIYIIGGVNVLNQLFSLIEEFYLTRIYGDFNCDKKIDLIKLQESMKLIKKIDNDSTCHFEIWKK